ncbi:MAG TPA: hypothetical protein V6C84_29550 [Coleofasciculaceae cyanobacterium]|jgi:hypothetical protein
MVTLAFLAAVTTWGCILLMWMTAIVPSLREIVSSTFQGQLLLAASLQTMTWFFLPQIQFIPEQMGQKMAIVMAGVTLFLLAVVVFSL